MTPFIIHLVAKRFRHGTVEISPTVKIYRLTCAVIMLPLKLLSSIILLYNRCDNAFNFEDLVNS